MRLRTVMSLMVSGSKRCGKVLSRIDHCMYLTVMRQHLSSIEVDEGGFGFHRYQLYQTNVAISSNVFFVIIGTWASLDG